MYLLDTNVISELRKPQADENVVEWARRQQPGDLYLSAISLYEIEMGVRRVERRDEWQGALLRRWFTEAVLAQFNSRVLPLDGPAARRAAELQVPDPKSERDCFIAAIALEHGLTVVTRNTKDFRVLGVALMNPWELDV